jgi:hypothetical protein
MPSRSPQLLSLVVVLALVVIGPAQAIVGGTPTDAFGQVSNGVQIAPNWVLTARHVGYTVGGGYANGYGVSTVAARYDFSVGDFPLNDLSLLRLDAPIAAPALTLNSAPLDPSIDVGGYQLDATIVTAANQQPRGYAHALVRGFLKQADPDDDGPLGPVDVNWLITYPQGMGAPYVQGGDSGGALFLGHVGDANAATPLWGITSAQLWDTDHPNDYRSAFVQLASYRGWIDATMSADLADTQLASWVAAAVPEPAPTALLPLGLAVLLGLSRRRARA